MDTDKSTAPPPKTWLELDLFGSSDTPLPLPRLINLWSSETGEPEATIIRYLCRLIIRTNNYLLTYKNLTIEDARVSGMLEQVLKTGSWKDITGAARDKQLLKLFYRQCQQAAERLENSEQEVARKDLICSGSQEVAERLDRATRVVALQDMGVDCEELFMDKHPDGQIQLPVSNREALTLDRVSNWS